MESSDPPMSDHPPEIAQGMAYALDSPLALLFSWIIANTTDILRSYGYFIVIAGIVWYYWAWPKIQLWIRNSRRGAVPPYLNWGNQVLNSPCSVP